MEYHKSVLYFENHSEISICYVLNIHVLVQLFSFPFTVHLRQEKFATLFNDDTNLHQTIFHNVFVYFKSYD